MCAHTTQAGTSLQLRKLSPVSHLSSCSCSLFSLSFSFPPPSLSSLLHLPLPLPSFWFSSHCWIKMKGVTLWVSSLPLSTLDNLLVASIPSTRHLILRRMSPLIPFSVRTNSEPQVPGHMCCQAKWLLLHCPHHGQSSFLA